MKYSRWLTLWVTTVLASLLGIEPVWASQYQLVNTFQAPEPTGGDYFGTAVVLEDGVAAIKSQSGYLDGDGLSSTHIFEQQSDSSWSLETTLEFSIRNDTGNPYIGRELAIDDGEIVIGYGLKFDVGAPVPLQFASRDESGWSTRFNEILPLEQRPNFARDTSRLSGRVVDISGDFAIAEATAALRPDGGLGAARIYKRSPTGVWSEVANLAPASGASIDAAIVAIDGTTAALVDRTFDGQGALYFFERQPTGEWLETDVFHQSPGSQGFFFRNIHIDGNTAVTRDETTGQISIYQREADGWSLSQDIPLISPGLSLEIFSGIAIDDGVIAYTDLEYQEPRSALKARRGSVNVVKLLREQEPGYWVPFDTIRDPKPEAGNEFGASLALDSGRLLVGASSTRVDRQRSAPGAAYLFAIVPEPSGVVLFTLAYVGLVVHRNRGIAIT